MIAVGKTLKCWTAGYAQDLTSAHWQLDVEAQTPVINLDWNRLNPCPEGEWVCPSLRHLSRLCLHSVRRVLLCAFVWESVVRHRVFVFISRTPECLASSPYFNARPCSSQDSDHHDDLAAMIFHFAGARCWEGEDQELSTRCKTNLACLLLYQ